MIGIIILITVVIVLIYVSIENRRKRQNYYFLKKGIPVSKPTSIFVVMRNMLTKNIAELIKSLYDANENNRVFGLYTNGQPTLFIRDPSIIKQLAIKDFDYFMDHQTFFKREHDPFFGNTLISMEGQKWRDMRSSLSPAFTGSKMRLMFELVNSCGEEMSNFFIEEYQKDGLQSYDMKDIYSKFTNDVIATCAFGVKCDSVRDPENDFYTMGKEMMNFQRPLKIIKLLVGRTLPERIAGKLFDMKLIDEKSRSIFSDIIMTTMKTREEKNIFRPDMINLLMELKKGQLKPTNEIEKNDSIATADDHEKHATKSHRVWSDDELIPQCFIFFLAGFDSSSTLMTFTAYELAVNPEVQAKLLEEIDEVDADLLGRPITYDRVQSMTYMDMVIAESLRKWPPAVITDRVCVKDYAHEFQDGLKISIEKGGSLQIPIFGIHRDPKYFPEPEKFDPERFSKENKSNIDFNAYLPFGAGPRNCIGSRFALMEAKVVIYHLLRNFTLEVCEKTQVPLKLKKTLAALMPENVLLTLKPRKQ